MDITEAKELVDKLNRHQKKYILDNKGLVWHRCDSSEYMHEEPMYICYMTKEMVRYSRIDVAAEDDEMSFAGAGAGETRAYKRVIVEVSSKKGAPLFSLFTSSHRLIAAISILAFGPDLAIETIDDAMILTSPLGRVRYAGGLVYGCK